MRRSDLETAPRPRTVPVVDADAIPAELRSLEQWVVWRHRDRDGRTTKVPYRAADPSSPAATDDPEAWSSFADAVIAIANPRHRLDGVGFVFTADDPYLGVDLDKCLDARGAVEPWAAEILGRLPGYAEISPSGSGVKLYLRAACPGGRGRKRQKLGPEGVGAIEVYDRTRYFAVTGRVLGPGHAAIVDAQAELLALHAELWPPPPAEDERPYRSPRLPAFDSDLAVFNKATAARNGAKFTQLWAGRVDGYPSQSEADLALCSLLSFYTQDPAVIERMFGQSGLVTPKWESRADYRAWTVAKALERREVYAPDHAGKNGAINPINSRNGHRGGDLSYSKYSQYESGGLSAGACEAGPVDPSTPWPAPALDAAAPAARFPVEALPGPLGELATVAAECLGCPLDFPALAALGVASGAMGRSVALAIKDGWVESPALYAALVGDPGMTKSPAVGLMARPLWSITRENLERHRREAERARKDKADLAPGGPARIVVDDATTEAMAGLLQDNPRGLVMVRDELSALLAGLNQYKAGGKGADRQFYLSAWSGSSVSVDRKHSPDRVPLHIPHPFLSIVGGMTPGMLGELGEAKGRDDGFLDRILFAAPDPIRVRWVDHGIAPDLALEWEHAIRRLWSAGMALTPDGRPRPHYVRFTPEASAGYAAWYDDHNREAEGDDFPPYLKGPWAKMRAYCARLALAVDRLGRAFDPEGPGEPADVGVDSLSRAIVLMAYFKSHTRRVRLIMRGALGENPDALAVLRWARRGLRPRFSAAEARNNFRRRFPVDGPELGQALAWLEGRHCIRAAAPAPAGPGPGRPRSPEYEVNPSLLGDMAGDD